MAIDLANPVNRKHPLNRGVVSRWASIGSPFSNGMYWRDLNKRHDGTLTNVPTWSVTRASGFSPSITCVFGSSSWVDCGNVSELNSVTYATMTAWIYRAATSDTAGFGRASSSTSGLNRYSAIWFSDGNLYVSCDDGSAASYQAFTLGGTGWHHIAMVFDGTQVGNARSLVYVDTVLRTPDTFSGTAPAALPSTSGGFAFGRDSTDRQTSGSYDCAAIWTRSLSSEEIAREYRESMMGYPGVLSRIPTTKKTIFLPAAASFKSAWARGSNVILQPGVLT